MKEEDIEELERRGFDSNTMEQKPRRKYRQSPRSRDSNELRHLTDISTFVFLMLILLFIMMLLLIPQAIYYIKLLEELA